MIPEEILAQVPGVARGAAPLAVQRLGQGTLNRAFLVTSNVGRFVVRLDRSAEEIPGVDRGRERLLQGYAAAAGLAPSICAAGEGFVVTRYAEGPTYEPGDLTDAAGIAALGATLARLHAIPAPGLEPFDLPTMARDYAALIAAREPGATDELARELELIGREVAHAHATARGVAIVHLDLHHTNVVAGERAVLLDWEFAQVGDPLLDLACWLAYYPAAALRAQELLARTGLADSASAEMLASLAAAFARLTALWLRALGAKTRTGGIGRSSAD